MSQADTLIPYHVPVPNRRPVSVLVLGIIGIVLASVVVLAYVASVVMWVVMRGFASRTLTYGGPTGVEDAWEVVDAIASLFFYAVLLWVSIAAIRMRPWARLGMLRWAGAYLAWVAVATAVVMAWVLPASLASTWNVGPNGQPIPPTPSDRMFLYGVVAASVPVNAAYPIVAIFIMRRSRVREAFEQAAGGVVAVAEVATAAAEDPPVAARSADPDPAEPLPLPPLAERAGP